MTAEIKYLRAVNSGLTNQVTELRKQNDLYERLIKGQDEHIADLKEVIARRTEANNLEDLRDSIRKEQIADLKGEVQRVRTENDKLRKSRDRWSLIFGAGGLILGGFLH